MELVGILGKELF